MFGGTIVSVRQRLATPANVVSGTITNTVSFSAASLFFTYVSGGNSVSPVTMPASIRRIQWTSGSLIVSHANSGFFGLFPWSGGTFGSVVAFSGALVTTNAGFDVKHPYIGVQNLSGLFTVFEQSGLSFGPSVSGPGSGIIGANTNRRTVAWHPSGTIVAALGNGSSPVGSYLFSSGFVGNVALFSGNVILAAVAWRPQGDFLGIVRATSTPQITAIFAVSGLGVGIDVSGMPVMGGMNHVSWSPDGSYLAAGGDPASGRTQGLFIHPFVSGSFSPAISGCDSIVGASGVSISGSINCVEWSPDGTQIAIGTAVTTGAGNRYTVYHWSGGLGGRITPFLSGPTGAVTNISWRQEG